MPNQFPPSLSPAQPEGSSTLGMCGQKDDAPSSLISHPSLTIPHQEGQAASIAHLLQLQREEAKFLLSVAERQGLPFPTQPLLVEWVLCHMCDSPRIPSSQPFIEQRSHAGRREPRRSESTASPSAQSSGCKILPRERQSIERKLETLPKKFILLETQYGKVQAYGHSKKKKNSFSQLRTTRLNHRSFNSPERTRERNSGKENTSLITYPCPNLIGSDW